MSLRGFIAVEVIQDSYNMDSFLQWIQHRALPVMNRYPLPVSVLIMDNVRIHDQQAIQALCVEKGVYLVFLPPYCPHLNPIEIAFGLIKRQLCLLFPDVSNQLLPAALEVCAKIGIAGHEEALYRHCGYFYQTEADRVRGHRNWDRLRQVRSITGPLPGLNL